MWYHELTRSQEDKKMAASAPRSLTVRLDPALYQAASTLSKRRNLSLNKLVQEALARSVREDEERELYDAFELLGRFPDECDVEYAQAAQAEVALSAEFQID
jgi:hypothetical protein